MISECASCVQHGDSLDELEQEYAAFVAARDWERFQTPQNLAMAVSIEANELLEEFLWFNNPSSAAIREDAGLRASVRVEFTDVLLYSVGLADQLDIGLIDAADEKLAANEARFDQDTASDIATKLEKWQ